MPHHKPPRLPVQCAQNLRNFWQPVLVSIAVLQKFYGGKTSDLHNTGKGARILRSGAGTHAHPISIIYLCKTLGSDPSVK